MREYRYTAGPGEEGLSIGEFLRRRQGFSARAVTKLKKSPRGILLDGVHARTVDRLHEGEVLTVTLEETDVHEAVPSSRRVEVLYEDEDLLLFNKPPGMPCHTSCGHAVDTLENVWTAYFLRQGKEVPPLRAVGRLDSDTSGCVLAAKNQFVASRLKEHYEREYCALVGGVLEGSGRIDAPIWRPDPVGMLRVVDPRGQHAVTEYRAAGSSGGLTLVYFRLLTGRTHQIRVHMAHIGHPIAGDTLYGGMQGVIPRQALHCRRTWFWHPLTGEKVDVCAPLPEDMRHCLREAGFLKEEEQCES